MPSTVRRGFTAAGGVVKRAGSAGGLALPRLVVEEDDLDARVAARPAAVLLSAIGSFGPGRYHQPTRFDPLATRDENTACARAWDSAICSPALPLLSVCPTIWTG